MKNKKKRKIIIFSAISVFILLLLCFLAPSFSELLDDDVRVAENSDLTYYIDVMYDGKDETEAVSNGTTKVRVFSDYIYVEDKLPDGLIFKNFVESEDGTIGAVQQNNPELSCVGYVVGGSDGIEYEDTTRTVKFKVRNLQAGCKVTVGIVTTTPSLGDKSRMDFYNSAFARENDFSTRSNTVHVFMGKEEEPLYSVTYQYEDPVPENAPAVPDEQQYAAGTSVAVSGNAEVAGYTFSGWKTDTPGVTVDGSGSFTMPESNVVFKGKFTAKETYSVTYEIEGDDVPEGYKPPRERKYGEGDDVVVDSLKVGDIVNGYRFLGWKVVDDDDVLIEDSEDEEGSGIFVMPPRNVKLRGSFERIDYEVSYQFQGNVLPPSWENLIPEASRHYPGDIVEVAPNPVAEGFEFLGWYKAESFEMPEEDVVITGEWKEKLGTFTPKITKVIDNEKVSYQEGDVVNFSITVENTANFEINDVFIQEETEGAEFVPDENNKYTVLNENYVKIPKMDPLESLVIKAKYVVQKDAVKRVTNKVSLVGAIASNKYTLAEGEYTSSVDFVVSNVVLNINKVSGEGKKLNGAEFTLYEDEGTQTVYGTGMSFKGLTPGKTYYLKETKVPYGYVKLNKVLYVSVDEAGSISIAGYEVTNVDGVATVNIANEKIDVLPNTGGVGNVPFVIGGLVIIVIAAFGCGYWFRKGKKKK